MLGERPRQLLGLPGVVLGIEHRAAGEGEIPAVLADRAEEDVERADVPRVLLPPAEFLVQISEVAFQQRPVHAGQAVRGDARGGEEGGEPLDHADRRAGVADAHPGAQPPPDPAFGQVPQPRLGDLPEVQDGSAFGDAQVPRPPPVPGELQVPAGAERELLHAAVCVESERAQPRRSLPGARAEAGPVVLGAVQQGAHAGRGQVPREPVHPHRHELRSGLIPAALQGVLHFQAQPAGQALQVDVLMPGTRIPARGDELLHVGPAAPVPALVVAVAEHRGRLGPQGAVGDPAGGWGPRRRRRGRLPGGQIRAPGTVPPLEVLVAQAMSGQRVTAAGDLAAGQRAVPGPAGAGGGREYRRIGFACHHPAVTVAPAHLPALGPAGRTPALHKVARRTPDPGDRRPAPQGGTPAG